MSNYFKINCDEPDDYMSYLRTVIKHMQVINKTRDPEKEELVSVSFYLQEFSYEGIRVQDVCKLLKEYDIICQFYFSEKIYTIDKTYSVHDIESKDISNCLFTIRCHAYPHDGYYSFVYYCVIEEISAEDRERIENADLDDIKADDATVVDCDSEDMNYMDDADYDKALESVYTLKLDKLYCHTDEGYNILLDMLDDDICDAKSALAPKLINENRTYYLVYLMRYYARIKSYLNEDSSLYSCTIKIDDIHLTQEAFNDFKTVMDSIGMEYIPMDFNSLDCDFDLRYILTVFYTGHETDKYMWTIQVIH